jgi:hypothetical protein
MRDTALDFIHITRKWAPLRRFAEKVIESALDAVKEGHIDVAQYFAKLLYFLPFAPMSIEKVLIYSLTKASHGYREKDPSLYEVTANEIPEFEPDEIDKVKDAFESLSKLGIAELISYDKIRLKFNVITGIIEPIVNYLAEDLNLREVDLDAISYPYKVISGINALYVINKVNRLPSSFTIMTGLLSPTAYVKKDGTVELKTTIGLDEWNLAKKQISKIHTLKDKFDIEYFKAIGFLHENRIIVRTYPIEVLGTIVNMVIAPAYDRCYKLRRERMVSRMRKWQK